MRCQVSHLMLLFQYRYDLPRITRHTLEMNILNIICIYTTIQSSRNKEILYGLVKPNKYTATELDGLLS